MSISSKTKKAAVGKWHSPIDYSVAVKTGENPLPTVSSPEALKTILIDRYTVIPSVIESESDAALARKACGEIRSWRGQIESRRKALKSDALEYGREVDSEAARWKSILDEVQGPILTSREVWDERKAAERRAKEEAERLAREKKRMEEEAEARRKMEAAIEAARAEERERSRKAEEEAKAAREEASRQAEEMRAQAEHVAAQKKELEAMRLKLEAMEAASKKPEPEPELEPIDSIGGTADMPEATMSETESEHHEPAIPARVGYPSPESKDAERLNAMLSHFLSVGLPCCETAPAMQIVSRVDDLIDEVSELVAGFTKANQESEMP